MIFCGNLFEKRFPHPPKTFTAIFLCESFYFLCRTLGTAEGAFLGEKLFGKSFSPIPPFQKLSQQFFLRESFYFLCRMLGTAEGAFLGEKLFPKSFSPIPPFQKLSQQFFLRESFYFFLSDSWYCR